MMFIQNLTLLFLLLQSGEDQLTPEKIKEEIDTIKELMSKSEEYLLDSIKSLDKGLQKSVVEKYRELLKKLSPRELLEELVGKSKGKQGEIVKKLGDLIKKIEEMPGNASGGSGSSGGGSGKGSKQQGQPQGKGQNQKQDKPEGRPADKPYSPNQADPLNKFKDIKGQTYKWGMLPPKERDRIFRELEMINSYPPRYRELIREYLKMLAEIKE